MNIFAHSGVNHSGAAETISHSMPQVLVVVLLVTLVVGALMFGALYLLDRFSLITVPVNERKR